MVDVNNVHINVTTMSIFDNLVGFCLRKSVYIHLVLPLKR
jgi:hypothetical protein